MDVAIFLALVAPLVWAVVVSFQKGKPWFGALGIVIHWFAIFGALRLAKPGSPWACKHYAHDPVKLARARARYPQHAAKSLPQTSWR